MVGVYKYLCKNITNRKFMFLWGFAVENGFKIDFQNYSN